MMFSTSEQLNWMVNIYLLSISIFIAIGGKISDLVGHRKIFLWGIFIFGVSSFFCGMSHTNYHLIVSRFVQGIGGALMIPSAIALLCDSFSEKNSSGES